MEYSFQNCNNLQNLLYRAPGFALYRLPWTETCHLVLQTSGTVTLLQQTADALSQAGFVMAPFHPTAQHPAVSIRPDIVADGWEAIEALPTSASFPATRPIPVHPTLPPPEDEATEHRLYQAAFERFITSLRQGRFSKLVLSRASVVEAPADFIPLQTFVRACDTYPRMLIYLCHTPYTGTWLGCTPEILLSGQGHHWHTVALAGTQPMQGETMPLNWDEKNSKEQALVADYIRNIVRSYATNLTEDGPYTARAGQVAHLKTDFRFHLNDRHVEGQLLADLHPTPAVCGLPKADALPFILDNEGYDRSYYSGFVGHVDPDGQTDLYVNLRCLQTNGQRLCLYAGGGILPSSDVQSEWEETQEKMDTLRRIIFNQPSHHP